MSTDTFSRLDLVELTLIRRTSAVLFIVLGVVGAGCGWLLYERAPTPYSASQGVLVSGGDSGTASRVANLDTEAVLAQSTGVLAQVADVLSLERSQALERYAVAARINSTVLVVTVTHADPEKAAQAARAAGKTYLEERSERRSTLLETERSNLEGHLTTLLIAERANNALSGPPLLTDEDLDVIAPLRNEVTRRLTELETTYTSPGSLIGEPEVSRSTDRRTMAIVSGLWLGLGVAMAAQIRRSLRVRRPVAAVSDPPSLLEDDVALNSSSRHRGRVIR